MATARPSTLGWPLVAADSHRLATLGWETGGFVPIYYPLGSTAIVTERHTTAVVTERHAAAMVTARKSTAGGGLVG